MPSKIFSVSYTEWYDLVTFMIIIVYLIQTLHYQTNISLFFIASQGQIDTFFSIVRENILSSSEFYLGSIVDNNISIPFLYGW